MLSRGDHGRTGRSRGRSAIAGNREAISDRHAFGRGDLAAISDRHAFGGSASIWGSPPRRP